MKIIYFHGFGSTGDSEKSRALAAIPGVEVIAPDLPINPMDVMWLVDSLVKNNINYPLVFVGTSLGGFYANYFSTIYDCPCVIVNPSISPSKTMAARMVSSPSNHKTGEPIVITDDHIQLFGKLESVVAEEQNGAMVNLFVAKDDDVLPYSVTLATIPHTASTVIMNDGGHRFTKHWPLVCSMISHKWGQMVKNK